MTKTLTLTLRTLTPLWTGGVDGTMDRLHETGLLGSLRWWYEAIVRGLGGSACDPTGHTCAFDAEKYRKSKATDERQRLRDAGLCDVCQVFGATGWQRRFRLEVIPKEGEIDLTEGMFPSGRVHPRGSSEYRVGGWMLRGGYFGTLILRFHGDEEILCCEILPTLRFIEQWGALGPKTSLGYGVIKIEEVRLNGNSIETCDPCANSGIGNWWWNGQLNAIPPFDGIYPALTNMFFAKVKFQPIGDDWWQALKEVKWLREGRIPKEEAIWTGQREEPNGPYEIPNSFPHTRLEHWNKCHHVFPIAPIVRNLLRYGSLSVCNGDGESEWCKFVFGTTQGRGPVCGYCGFHVREDRNNRQRYWCRDGKVSLAKEQIIQDSKRIQSKIRVSWAYQLSNGEWEIRIWGWLPEDTHSEGHLDRRIRFLSNLRNRIGASDVAHSQRHRPQNGNLWSALNLSPTQVCLFERQSGERVKKYLEALLNACQKTAHGDTGNTESP